MCVIPVVKSSVVYYLVHEIKGTSVFNRIWLHSVKKEQSCGHILLTTVIRFPEEGNPVRGAHLTGGLFRLIRENWAEQREWWSVSCSGEWWDRVILFNRGHARLNHCFQGPEIRSSAKPDTPTVLNKRDAQFQQPHAFKLSQYTYWQT